MSESVASWAGGLFWDLGRTVVRYRILLWELSKRELRDRHVGSVLGSLWVFLHPAILIGTYALVFTQVFKVRLGGTPEMPLGYTCYIFAGLLPWIAISDSMTRSTVALTSNASLVKQVVFPIEILPIKSMIASVLVQIFGILLAAAYAYAAHDWLPWSYALLPLALVLEVFVLAGLGWMLSAVGAYFRDLRDILQILLMIGMYCMPVFYVEEWVPAVLRLPILINPFTHLIFAFQDAMYYGTVKHPWSWAFSLAFSAVSLCLGYWIFRKCKSFYGSIL